MVLITIEGKGKNMKTKKDISFRLPQFLSSEALANLRKNVMITELVVEKRVLTKNHEDAIRMIETAMTGDPFKSFEPELDRTAIN